MLYRRLLALTAVLVAAWITSCEGALTYLLVQQLLDDKAPTRTWSGTVRDNFSQPVEGVQVQVRAEVVGDTQVMVFDDTTDQDGKYSVKFRYNAKVDYHLQVVSEGEVVYAQTMGKIEFTNQETDIVLQRVVGGELSGMIQDWNGDPLDGVLVIGATATDLDAIPATLEDGEGGIQYVMTNDSGVYQISGPLARYGIICAYHPDYGFAYAHGEDTDTDGSIPLSLKMGDGEDHRVQVQVVDNNLDPISLQVLAPDRQFRLRLIQNWNLSLAVDEVVTDQGLFPGLIGSPSEAQPPTATILVQATGLNGMADNDAEVIGSSYALQLVHVNDDDPATALVVGDAQLAVHEDTVIQIRVN